MNINEENILMPIELAGIKFRNPFCVSSGPASKLVDQLIKAQKCGWAGASIKLTFDPAPYINLKPRYRWYPDINLFSFSAETRLNIEEGLKLIEQGRKKTRDFILFANISYSGDKGLYGWGNMAKRFESAGAHIIELNLCCSNMSYNVEITGKVKEGGPLSGASLGKDEIVSIVKAVKKSVSIPVFVKLTSEGGREDRKAKASFEAGADGVCGGGGSLGISPININNPKCSVYNLQKEPSIACLTGLWAKPIALRNVYAIRKMVGKKPVIIGAGGVSTFQDAVEMSMAGADLIGICTAILINDFDFLKPLIKKLKTYLNKMGYKSLKDVRDILVENITPNSNLTIEEGVAVVNKYKCIGCGRCLKIGHCNAIKLVDNKAYIDTDKCLGCGICSFLCPQRAIEMNQINKNIF